MKMITTRPDPQRYLVQLLEQAPVGVMRLGPDGRIASANPAACELLELTQRELEGRALMTLFDNGDALERAIAEVLKLNEGITVRTSRGPEGSSRHVEINLQPFDAPETGPGVMSIIQDVTERVVVNRQREEILSQVEFLAETSASLGSSVDLDEVFAQLSRIVVPMLADWCALDVMDESMGVRRVGVYHRDPSLAGAAEALSGYRPDAGNRAHPVVRAIVKERPVIMSDLGGSDLRSLVPNTTQQDLISQLGARSMMVIPLVARDRLLGTLSLVSATNPKRYGATQLLLARDVGARAALALDNARLLEEHIYLARRMQESLLPPSLPEVDGLEIAARYQAAGQGIEVGGDFYDFFRTGTKSWNVVVGDVSGKGADAAVVTALARYTLRAAAMQARAPRRILAKLNDAIYEQTPPERFSTVVLARVRTDGGAGSKRTTIACGGHPLPLLLRVDGTIEEVGVPGTALGLLPKVDIKDVNVTLEPGDALVLFTDGVTEARSGDHLLGIHGLRTALAACKGRDADGIAEHLAATTLSFQKQMLRDDMAIVVLRVPSPEP